MHHRKPRTSVVVKRAVGFGVVATAGLAMTTTVASAAAGPGFSRDAAVAVDMAHSRADRTHVNQFDESFEIHEYGPSVAVTANNRATAESVGCSLDSPCRSVALSFQIVTTSGRNARLVNASNISRAANGHCTSCQTFAGAYQFVVATPQAFRLSRAARADLSRIDREVALLKGADLTISQVRRRADELAAQVKRVLDREADRAPRGGEDSPLTDFEPTVTMHRHVR
ncbi:hypothetical protein [Streptomyces heilongjiangensis]|uniref:Uncharacterized protein n=1 Tax=Streptomyces heilongjiangensis TaxID=945052 RepID=A0ABW1B9Y9_9ACTN|nr:hypothetical protein [Streptomyces heilongjiangensis]MDC2951594.1 hypothetical protein [Streptomyces heilongjiangensis]